MRVLFDTSVLVAACATLTEHHTWCKEWLQRAMWREIHGLISAHTLAEVYSTLTRLPLRPRISPTTAWQLIEQNIVNTFEFGSLDALDYLALIEQNVMRKVIGGRIYDAIIAYTAEKYEVNALVTLNPRHFVDLLPSSIQMIAP